MKKPNSTLILNCQSRMVKNYLAKLLCIIENDYKQLSMLPNDVKIRIHLIGQLEKYFSMAKNTAISSIANTTKITYSEKYAFYLPTIIL